MYTTEYPTTEITVVDKVENKIYKFCQNLAIGKFEDDVHYKYHHMQRSYSMFENIHINLHIHTRIEPYISIQE